MEHKIYEVCVYSNGHKYWYLDGQRHHTDGPAVEFANGDKEWYLNGQRHRTDGPAIEYANGNKEWYVNGQYLTEAEFIAKTTLKPSCESKIIEVDGKKYRLTEI